MVELEDIIEALEQMLYYKFDVDIISTDMQTELPAPCFYVQVLETTVSQVGECLRGEDIRVRVCYYPENKDQFRAETIDMKRKLAEAFLPKLRINDDFYIPINEVKFQISEDKVLMADMNLFLRQEMEDEEEQAGSVIESLDYRQ